MTPRLPRAFFERDAVSVGQDLLGRAFVRVLPSGERLSVRIVETEAYEPEDPASHSFGGPSPRNAVMFGRAGHLYVYLVYGIHWCANVVTGVQGRGSAVLLRAGEPTAGLGAMRRYRGGRLPLAAGPARLAQALAIDGNDNGEDLCARSSDCWIERTGQLDGSKVACGPRIGIRRAAEVPWRFWESGSPFVSGSARLNAAGAPRTP